MKAINNAAGSSKAAYTIDEVAKALTLSRSSLKTLIGRGLVRVVRLGRRVVIPASEIVRILEGDAVKPPADVDVAPCALADRSAQ